MRLAFSIYLAYFMTSLIGLEIWFQQLESKEKYVSRVTKRSKQIVDYRLVLLKVIDLDTDQGWSTLKLLSNECHLFEKTIVIKAAVSKNQIKAIKANKASQIEADLQVVINTRSNIPQVETKVMRVTKYI